MLPGAGVATSPAPVIMNVLTPGAPAGLGVREAVLVEGLAPLMGASDAAGGALLVRLLTTPPGPAPVATGLPTPASRTLPDRDDTVFSPRAAALYHVTDTVTAWGSFGTGFRAPPLNELYRQFRVGAVLTLANEALGPERLTGVEGGVSVAATRPPATSAQAMTSRLS